MSKKWIEKLKEYYFREQITTTDIELSMKMKNENIPSKLYKYRRYSDHSLDNFYNDTVWLCRATDFNDPYDSALCFDFPQDFIDKVLIQSLDNEEAVNPTSELKKIDRERLMKSKNPDLDLLDQVGIITGTEIDEDTKINVNSLVTSILSKHVEEMVESLSTSVKESTYICSFSECVESILMWSHYADEHSGFAVEYDFSNLGTSDLRSRMMWPIIYSDDVFDISKYLLAQQESKVFNNLFGTIAAIHKSKEWEYEREWRLVFSHGFIEEAQNFKVPKAKAIYLGARIGKSEKDELIALSMQKGIQVFQMALSPRKFSLEPNPIS